MWDLSFPIRNQTSVPCIGRQILNHWTTRQVPPAPLAEETIFPPLSVFACFVIDYLTMGACFFLWTFILFHCSIFLFLYQYSPNSWSLIAPALSFFLKIALVIQGLLCFHTNCKLFCCDSVKDAIGDLIGSALNLLIALGSIIIFIVSNLSFQEHGISLHLYHLCLLSSASYKVFRVQVFCLLR